MTKVQIWAPNIFEFKGGIQVYSEFLLEALKSYPLKSCRVVLKHDRQVPEQALKDFQSFQFSCCGQWPLSIRTLAFSAELVRLACWEIPDLIITTHLNFTPLAYYLKQFLGIPYWTVAHGVDAWNITDNHLVKSLLNADLILSVSQYTRNRLLDEHNLDVKKIEFLPNTFNATNFYPLPKSSTLLKRYNLTDQQPIILTVARLDSTERYKGYDQIIKALPRVKHQIPNVHYILGGKGKDRSRIEKLIQDLELTDSVTLTGFISDEELCDHYNLCDVFAMPSKGEGFGIVYLEALACGKPTLGGNQDGAIDALCHGEIGVLVDPDNLEKLAETLILILQGRYPNSVIYQPSMLRQKVIETYGFVCFQRKLTALLRNNGF